jgi:DNA replication protein DnaC
VRSEPRWLSPRIVICIPFGEQTPDRVRPLQSKRAYDWRCSPSSSLRSLLTRLSRIDVLVIDDWAMAPMSEAERRDFWEICEDRYQTHSTLLTSQLPVARWHEQIGDPTAADGILDRLVHNAHRIDMRGESMRKKRSIKPPG